jgi:DNA polymerase (family X)
MTKDDIALILKEIGVLLELKGENKFKCLAYLNAARTLETLQQDLAVLIAEGKLGEVKGIGSALQEKIVELHTTGKLAYYEELKGLFPSTLLECLQLPGLGPKKLKILWEKLKVDSIQALQLCCERGLVADLDGFGAKTQTKLLEGIANYGKYRGQFLLMEAMAVAEPILKALQDSPDVRRAEIAGSMRRRKELIRDLDFVVSTNQPKAVMDLFTSLPDVSEVTNRGPTKSSVILSNGIQADVRCVSEEEYPSALLYFTGSKEHNIILRQRAIDQGKKLNEYGLFRVKDEKETLISCVDEQAIYRDLGLGYIPPVLREDMGELDAAESGRLPKLVSREDIRGTLHCHTLWSDGRNSVEEMARAAIARGWEYIGISDHSKTMAIANGLSEKRLLDQIQEIREVDQKLQAEGYKLKILAGSECDILPDGSLDYSDEILGQLDFVVISIHQNFGGDASKQTTRMIRAMANPHASILGHITGRLLLAREPYKLDIQAVIEAAAATKTIIEFNATPSRMELDWRWWKAAVAKGVLCALTPDAHSIEELDQTTFGLDTASKGWLTAADVVNTRSLKEVMPLLNRKRSGMTMPRHASSV